MPQYNKPIILFSIPNAGRHKRARYYARDIHKSVDRPSQLPHTFLRPASVILYSLLLITSLILVTHSSRLHAQILFEETTAPAGIDNIGRSWGSAWGDFNRDGWPDVWTSNHQRVPSLFLNMRDGTFLDIASQTIAPEIWATLNSYDTHGAAWADFDNDGDQDLIQQADGGTPPKPNHLYVNVAGQQFVEAAAINNLDLPLQRGRTPLWLDWNNDGLLDIVLSHLPHVINLEDPTVLYEQQAASGFQEVTDTVGLNVTYSNFAFLSNLDISGKMELMVVGPKGSPALNLESIPFTVLDPTIGLDSLPNAEITDIVSADLNGDLAPDLHMVRGPKRSNIVQVDATTLEASIGVSGQELGFSFQAPGTVTFDLYPKWRMNPASIFIGSNGIHPADSKFSLSINDPEAEGIANHAAGINFGIYIGYDATTQTWQLLFSASSWATLNVIAEANVPLQNVSAINFDPSQEFPPSGNLLVNNNGIFQDRTLLSGIEEPSSGHNIVAGDFDNDMDTDLYIVATGPVQNLPNILYENAGNGQFTAVPGAGGAAGTSLGKGGTVSVSDYNRDGFLDLFVTNAIAPEPFNIDGPVQLFRNAGNSNHWIELDLEGVQSNRDGIGTRILATAGGITQLREQGGGMHFRTQNHQRIHFGLAGNTAVDSVTVNWPSGITQTINNLPADEIVHVLEPSYPSPAGKPDYQPGLDEGLFLWKDTFDGPYHVEANGSGPSSIFSFELITDQPIASVTARSFESNDSLAWSGRHLTLESQVGTWFDGLDIQLPPATRAMMAVAQDGSPNPRQLHIGASGQPLTPSGWIVETDTLPPPPPFQGGQDLGLFIGRDTASGEVRARWNGDGPNHRAAIELLFSQIPNVVTPVGIEANDTFTTTANAVSIDSFVGSWWDGANVSVPPGTRMGLAYTQDGLVQPHRVNPATRSLGLPNAYRLPRAEPYGKPVYDPGTEAGLYLWQDKATGAWHLRGAAGGGGGRYTGELVSDQPFTTVSAVSIEANDVLDTTDPLRIVFDLGMGKQWEDGIDFQTAPGAQLTLNLTSGRPFSIPGKALRIGESKWPVDNLPLDLGGW